MDNFWESLRKLFALSDEELEKVANNLSNSEKVEEAGKKSGAAESKEDKPEVIAEGVRTKQAASNTEQSKGADEMTVSMSEYKKIQDELAAVKSILEKNNADAAAEKRMNKIKGYKDCLDHSYLSTLLEGVDEKDFDSKVEEIKKEKGYLFSKPETDGFNPAEPSNTMDGVQIAFYKQNPDLNPQF